VLHDRRRALHARIVGAVEALYSDRLAEHAERLAHHALQGEDWDQAARYGRRAGTKSLARSANREAAAYFQQALSALGQMPDSRPLRELAVDLRLDLYHSLLPVGELLPILDYLREAEALARALEDPSRQGWASLHICHLLLLIGECTQAIESGRAALTAADLLGDGTLEVVANHWLGARS
jgi:predicted ATPase